MAKAVLFDMDGVILDSMRFHVAAWKRAMAEFGLSVDEELLYLHEGAIEPATAVRIFCDNGCSMDEETFAAILARQMEIFSTEFRPRVRPYPEVRSLVERLRQDGWRMAVVTSSHGRVVEETLPPDLASAMDLVVTGDRVPRRKPHPDPYIAAITGLGLAPGEAVVVENAPAGIRAAKAAGARCVAITTTLPAVHLSEADVVVGSHGQVLDSIRDGGERHG